jgi:uncharacterized membrane protein
MNQFFQFAWRTILRGVLFLATLLIAVLLVREAIRLVGKLLAPIAQRLPFSSVLGIAVADLVAALTLLIVALLFGMLSQTKLASRVNQLLEHLILRKVPGYTLLKSVAHGAIGTGDQSDAKVALANIDDAWLISFIIEEHPSGMLTVFVPSAPTPTAGSIYFLTEQQVKRLDVPVSAAMKCIMQLGVGSRALIEGKTAAPGKPAEAQALK